MRRRGAAFAAAFGLLAGGCRGSVDLVASPDGGTPVARATDGGADGVCADCISRLDCAPSLACVQVGTDSNCRATCRTDADCGPGTRCLIAVSSEGEQARVCIAATDPCEPGSRFDCDDCPVGTVCVPQLSRCDPAGPAGGRDGGAGTTCGTLASPSTWGACCQSCKVGTGDCQSNGCYGGWWCDTSTCRCHAPSPGCADAPDAGAGGGPDAGGVDEPPVDGEVGPSGGSVSRLFFAVVGDTRPAFKDAVSQYPTAVIERIYGALEALSPRPSFAVATGDYMFATPGRNTAAPQLALYAQAQRQFQNQVFHALGNHECTGFTGSNCGTGNRDGTPDNYQAFLSALVEPLGRHKPYYAFDFTGLDGRWTAKVVVVAANAWDAAQAAWLDQALARRTTFTFVVRHEPTDDTKAPGTQASEQIIRRFPLTLEIVGHTHLFSFRPQRQELVVGNGGAPLTSGAYGFATLSQVNLHEIVIRQYDYSSTAPSRSWSINENGSLLP